MKLNPIQHATGIVELGDTVIYFDPVGEDEVFAAQKPADIVLVTHAHGDHFNVSTLEAVVDDAPLIVPQSVYDELPEGLTTTAQVLKNGDTTEVKGVRITAVPAYNFPDRENAKYHPQGWGNGYVLEKDSERVYVAGDTAGVPEMKALTDIDLALVPMNMPYTMSVEEAAEAVLAFKPKQVAPYHYDGSDIQKFKELVNAGDTNIEVNLLEWYPNKK